MTAKIPTCIFGGSMYGLDGCEPNWITTGRYAILSTIWVVIYDNSECITLF